MKPSYAGLPMDLDRMNGLFAWWGVPNTLDTSEMEARTKRCLALAVDLNQLFNQAVSDQAQALCAENEMFARTLQEFLNARQPPELMAAQSNLVTGLLESLAAQTKAWAELTQELHECCAAMGRAEADGTRGRTDRDVPVKSKAKAKRPGGKRASKQAV